MGKIYWTIKNADEEIWTYPDTKLSFLRNTKKEILCYCSKRNSERPVRVTITEVE